MHPRNKPQGPVPGLSRGDRVICALAILAATWAVWHAGTAGGDLHETRPWAAWLFYAVAAVTTIPVAVHYHRGVKRFKATGRAAGLPLRYALVAGVLVWGAGTLMPLPGPQVSWGIAAGVGVASLYPILVFPDREQARRILAAGGSDSESDDQG